MAQVILNERADEVIAVVVAGLQTQGQCLAVVVAGAIEAFGLQLRFEKFVRVTLIDQDRAGEPRATLDQRAGVIGFPGFAVIAEIARQCLVAPRHLAWRDDRRECGHGFVAIGVPQRDRQCAVTAHRMTADALAGHIRRCEVRAEHTRKFLRDVAIHTEAFHEVGCGRVEIEAGTFAKFPVAGRTVDAGVARTGVRRDQDQAKFRRDALRPRLDDEGFLGAGQPGEVIQHRRFRVMRQWRPEHPEFHRAAGCARCMSVETLHAIEAALLGNRFDAHRMSSRSAARRRAQADFQHERRST